MSAIYRGKLLEKLIKKYAWHGVKGEGVSFLADHYRGAYGGVDDDAFTDEEWTEIRLIVGEEE